MKWQVMGAKDAPADYLGVEGKRVGWSDGGVELMQEWELGNW